VLREGTHLKVVPSDGGPQEMMCLRSTC
jgi:hypothetical protein